MSLHYAHDWPSPWRLVASGALADAPSFRDESVELGRWVAPAGYPCRVMLTRATWSRPGRSPSKLATGVPSLLIEPLARPVQDMEAAEAAFRQWKRTAARGAPQPRAWRPNTREVVWRTVLGEPDSLSLVADVTTIAAERAAEGVPASSKARQAYLTKLWQRAPWLFLISRRLLEEVYDELGLLPDVPEVDALLAARGSCRGDGFLSGRVHERAVSERYLRAWAFDALLKRQVGKQAAASFLEGKPRESPYRWSTVKDEILTAGEVLEDGMMPSLVPLTTDPVTDDEPDFSTWVSNWLSDGRAARAIWLVFGRCMCFLNWNAVPEGTSRLTHAGLCRTRRWVPSVVPAGGDDYVGWIARWHECVSEEAQEDDAAPGDDSFLDSSGNQPVVSADFDDAE